MFTDTGIVTRVVLAVVGMVYVIIFVVGAADASVDALVTYMRIAPTCCKSRFIKGGAVETGCSNLYDDIYVLIYYTILTPIHCTPTPTAPPL